MPYKKSYLSTKEAAKFLKVSPRTLRRWKKNDLIKEAYSQKGQSFYAIKDLKPLKKGKYKSLSTRKELSNTASTPATPSISKDQSQKNISAKNTEKPATNKDINGAEISQVKSATFGNNLPTKAPLVSTDQTQITPPTNPQPINTVTHKSTTKNTDSTQTSDPPSKIIIGSSLFDGDHLPASKNWKVFSVFGALAVILLISGLYLVKEPQKGSSNQPQIADSNLQQKQGILGRVLGITTNFGTTLSFQNIIDNNFNFGVTGTLEGSQVITSTQTQPPLVVNSNSRVANLNADLLDGKHYSEIEALINNSSDLQKGYDSGSTINTDTVDIVLNFTDQSTDADFEVNLLGNQSTFDITGNSGENIMVINPNALNPVSISSNTSIGGSLNLNGAVTATNTLTFDDGNTGTIAFSDATNTTLPTGYTSILDALAEFDDFILASSGAGLFIDGGSVSYLVDTAEDFAIGGSGLSAALSVDVSGNTVRIGDGADNNAALDFYASDGDTGRLAYNTSDEFKFEGGNVVLTQDLTVEGADIFGANSERLSIGGTDDIIALIGSGGSDNTDVYINLDGTFPTLYSATDTSIGIDDDLVFVGSQQISSTTGNITLAPSGNFILSGFDCTGNSNGGALTANASGVISCTDDDGGGSTIAVEEGDTTVTASADTFDFLANDFIISESPAGEINISVDYANSGITRDDQVETITGAWTFSSGITLSGSDLTLGTNNIVTGSSTLASTELDILDGGILMSELTDSGTLSVSSVNIDGGAIDGTIIGANSAAAGTFTSIDGTSITVSGEGSFGSLTINSESFTNIAGSGLIRNGGQLDVDLVDSNSGLAFNSGELSLRQDCSSGQIVEWNGSGWVCGSDDIGGGSNIIVQEGDSTVVNPTATFDFLAGDFSVSLEGTSEANISIDYANSNIARTSENETLYGNWTFANTLTAGTLSINGEAFSDLSGTGLELASNALRIDEDAALSWTSTQTFADVDINGGAIDGTTIGATSAASGTFTTLAGTSASITNDASVGTLTINSETFSDLTGDGLTISSGVLTTTLGTSIDLTAEVTGVLAQANGGTGLDTSSVAQGQLLIGNASNGFDLATLTDGTGVTITEGDGSITIASTLGTSISASEIDADSLNFTQFGDALILDADTNIAGNGTAETLTMANGTILDIEGTFEINNEQFSSLTGNGLEINGTSLQLATSTGGAGLTYSSGVLAVGAGSGITVNANDVAINLATNSGLNTTSGLAVDSSIAGTGLSLTAGVLDINTGTGLTSSGDNIVIDTTSSLTWSADQSITGNLTVSGLISSGSLIVSGETTLDSLYVTNNIALGGTVDGRDLASDGSDLDELYTTIGLSALTTAEVNQLENIDSVTITNGQWAYLGGQDQAVATTDTVTFSAATITNDISAGSLTINSETFTNLTGNGLSIANGILQADSGELATLLSGWDQDASDDLTTANYSTTLDSVYVNVGESPSAGDITGSFSGGLNIGGDVIDFTELADALTLDANTTVSGSSSFTFNNGGGLQVSNELSAGTLTVNSEAFSTLTGSGLALSGSDLIIDLINSNSGLAFASGELGLRQDCSTNQILAWNGSGWVCAADSTSSGGGADFTVEENNSSVVNPVSSVDFLGADFNVSLEGTSEANISIDYANSAITRSTQAETVYGNWNFVNTLTTGTLSLGGESFSTLSGEGLELNGTSLRLASSVAGTGLNYASGVLSTTLGTAIDTSEITDNTITFDDIADALILDADTSIAGTGTAETLTMTNGTILDIEGTLEVNNEQFSDLTGTGLELASNALRIDEDASLTWTSNQTFSADISVGSFTINAETFTNLTGDGLSIANGILSADAGELATLLSGWDQNASDDLTTGNYGSTLDSVYVNVGESPSAGDITGSFSGGLNIGNDVIDFDTIIDSMILDADTTISGNGTSETLTMANGTILDIDGTFELNNEQFSTLTGNGLEINGNALQLATSTAGTGLAYSSGVLSVNTGTGLTTSGDNVLIDTTAALSWTGTQTFSDVDINGGAIDGTTIGATTPAAGTFTTLAGTSASITNDASVGTLTINSETFSDLTGTGLTISSGALATTLGTSIDLTSEVTGILPQANGGTGLDTSSVAQGQLLIGNNTNGFDLATLTDGTGVTITEGDGSITIASTLGTSIDSSEIEADTITLDDIANSLALDGDLTFTGSDTIYANNTGGLVISNLTSSGSLIVSGETTLDSLYVTNNIALGGTVDGRDVAADGSNLDTLYTTIGLSALTEAEVNQLENINSVTISNAQWGYLGGQDQAVATTDSVTFSAATITNDISVGSLTINSETFTNLTGTGLQIANGILEFDSSYFTGWDQDASDDLTTGNYSTTLDSVYVNVGESPSAGDITGSFSGGLNIGGDVIDFTEIADALTLDANTTVSGTNSFAFNNAGGLQVTNELSAGTLTVNSEAFSSLTGSGLALSGTDLQIDLINSNSGLAFASGELGLRQDCSTNQILAWNGSGWACAADSTSSGGGADFSVEENNSLVVNPVSSVDFLGADFNVSLEGTSEANISIDYANSAITRSTQAETVYGNWNFVNTLTAGTLSIGGESFSSLSGEGLELNGTSLRLASSVAGTGLNYASGVLSTTLGTSIDTTEITNNTITFDDIADALILDADTSIAGNGTAETLTMANGTILDIEGTLEVNNEQFSSLTGAGLSLSGTDLIFNSTELSDLTWGSASPFTWTFNTGTNDPTMTFNDGEIVFNEAGLDTLDLRVEGSSESHLLFADASNDRIGIGTDTPSYRLSVEYSDDASGTLYNSPALHVLRTASGVASGPLITSLLQNTSEVAGGSDYQNEVHLRLQAGSTNDHRRYLNFTGYDGVDDWLFGANANNVLIGYDANSASHRIWFENTVTPGADSGNSYINSAGSGSLIVNGFSGEAATGTGGLQIWSGGSSPTREASINNDGFLILNSSSAASYPLHVIGDSGAGATARFDTTPNSGGYLTIGGANSRPLLNLGTTGDTDELQIIDNGAWTLGTTTTRDLEFKVNGSDVITLDGATGNVGIGDNTPSQLLSVGNGDLFTVDTSGNIVTSGTLTINSETFSDLTGTGLSISNGALVADLGTSIDLTTEVTGVLPQANGGTGLDTSSVAQGQLLIGNNTNGFDLATLTDGTGVTITEGDGSITIASTLGTSVSGSEIDADSLDFTEFADALTLDADTTISGNGTSETLTMANGTILDINGTLDIAGEAFSSLTGNGLVLSGTNLQLDILDSTDGTGSTSSVSGFEFAGGSSDELALLQGCSDGEVLKWTEGSSTWSCATDTTGSGAAAVHENGSEVTASLTTLDFLGADFNVTDSPAGEANVSIDYANSNITRSTQAETVYGNWNFVNTLTAGTLSLGGESFSTLSGEGLELNGTSLRLASSVAGTGLNYASGVLSTTLGTSVDLTSEVTGVLPQANGGTGIDTSSVAQGQLLIGNNTNGFDLATLTDGTGVTITEGDGSITIASTLGTSIDSSEIDADTITFDNIADALTLDADTSIAGNGANETLTMANGTILDIEGTLEINNEQFSSLTGNGLEINGTSLQLATSTGGAGLTYSSGVLAVGAGSGITVNANDVAINLAANSGLNTTSGLAVDSSIAGTGLTLTSGVLDVSGLTASELTADTLDFTEFADALTLDANTSITNNGTANTLSFGSGVELDVNGSFEISDEAFSSLTGNGLALSGSDLAVDLISTNSGTGATSSPSGLEFASGEVGLLQGCADNEILKYTDAGGWACATDNNSAFAGISLTADSGSNETVNEGDIIDIAGGTNISTAVGATDTVTVNLDSDLTGLTSVAVDSLRLNGSTLGISTDTDLLSLADNALTVNGSINATSFLLSGTDINTAGTLSNVAYLNQANTFTADQTINTNLAVAYQASVGTLSLGGEAFSSLSGEGLELNGTSLRLASSVAGTGLNYASGVLSTTLGTSIDLTSEVTGILPVGNGGTGINGGSASNGSLLIGNGTGFTNATLTAGTGITINNASGSIEIVNDLGASISSSEIVDGTITGDDIQDDVLDFVDFSDSLTLDADTSIAGNGTAETLTMANGTILDIEGTFEINNEQFSSLTGNGLELNGTSLQLATSTGGAGLTYSSGVLAVGAGSGITVNANDVAINLAANSGLNTTSGLAVDSSIAGTGLTLTSGVLDINTGTGLTSSGDNIVIDTTAALSWTGTQTFSDVDINGGNIDGTTIGASSPAAGTFTTLAGTSASITNNASVGTFTINGETFSDLTGTGLTLSSGTLATTLGTSIDLTSEVTSILPQANGGTGIDTSSVAQGQLLIGNNTNGFDLATLTDGTGITITEGDGSITIASTLGTSVSGSEIDADSLDFTEFADALTLDAATDIATAGFTLSTSGTGALDFNSTGQVSFAGNLDAENGLDVTGNITATGTVDGRDIAADGSNLDTLYTTIGLSALTAAEVNQLENIGAVTISATQWGYLGSSNQGISTTDAVTFDSATITNDISAGSLTINSETFTNLTGTGLSIANGILQADSGELATLLSGWDQNASDDLTTGNYSTTLDSVYVNVGESPSAGDITGSFSGGLNIGNDVIDFTQLADALTLDANTSITNNGTANTLSFGNGVDVSIAGSLTVNSESFSSLTGTGLSLSGNTLVADLGTNINSAEIVNNTITTDDLNATLTFADGDLLDLSGINNSVTTEGLLLPQTTNCSSATAEGQICWDSDNDTLAIGNGTTTTTIGTGSMSSFNIDSDDNNPGTITDSEELLIAGGTNITSANGGSDTVTINLDSDLTGLTSVAIDSLRLNGTTLGLSTDTDLLSLANDALTVNGTLDVTSNITVGGTVDGRDIAADGSNLDNLYTTIGLSALTAAEVNQLENINSVTITNGQWGYLGGLNQSLATTDSVTFGAATITNDISAGSLTLSSETFTNLTGIGLTITNGILEADSTGLATLLSGWDQDASDDLTTANYSTTLDSVYVNVGESPAAGDITGSFSAGLDLGTGVIDFDHIANSLTLDANTDISAGGGSSLTFNSGTTLDIDGNISIADTNIAFDGTSTTFTTNGAFTLTPGGAVTLGDGGDTLAINSSDWDISTTGSMTGISGISNNGAYTQTGSSQNTFTGNVDASSGVDVTGGSLTVGGSNASITTAGVIDGTQITVDSLNLNGSNVGLSTDTDLIALADNAVTVNGSVDATNLLVSGSNINTAGTLTNVAYLNQANSFTANQDITGNLTTSGITSSGTLSISGNTTLGNQSSDTLTINAGSSGSGITLADISFNSCTALETVSGVLTCGTDDTGGGSLWSDGTNGYYNNTEATIVGADTSFTLVPGAGAGDLRVADDAEIIGDLYLGGQIQIGQASAAPTALGDGAMYYNTTDDQLYVYDSKSWVSLDPTKANKNTLHALYRSLADTYDQSGYSNQYKQYESIARGVFFDNLKDGTKYDGSSTTAGLDPYKQKTGLWGGSAYDDLNQDTDGNKFLGGDYVRDVFYYDRTEKGLESSPEKLVEIGIDPNWHQGVTLVSATPSAQVNWQPATNLTPEYNGSVIEVSGRYASGEEDDGILITIVDDHYGFSSPGVTFDWKTLDNPNSPSHSASGVNVDKGETTTLETGTNDISITFSPQVTYHPGDQFLISSWWLEPETANDRGPKQDFPRQANLIGHDTGFDIIDDETNKLWMRLNEQDDYLFDSGLNGEGAFSVHMLNGRIYLADDSSAGGSGMYELAFDHDIAYRYSTSGKSVFLGKGLADRNSDPGNPYHADKTASAFALADNQVNDVHANIINNRQVVAVATDAGLTVIDSQAPGSLDLAETATDDYEAVWVDQDDIVWGLNETDGQLDSWRRPVARQTGDQTNFAQYSYDETTTPALTNTAPTIANDAPDALYVTEERVESKETVTVSGWSLIQGDNTSQVEQSNNYGVTFDSHPNIDVAFVGATTTLPKKPEDCTFIYHAVEADPSQVSNEDFTASMYFEGTNFSSSVYFCYSWTATGTVSKYETRKQVFVGTDQGLSALSVNDDSVKYYTNTYFSEEMIGDVRGMWPLDSKYGSGLSDASAQGETLTNAGTTTFVSGVRGEGAELDGSTQYLHCSDAACGGTTNLDFASTDSTTFMGWINPDSITSGDRILAKGTLGGFDIYFNSSNSLTFQLDAVDELTGTTPIPLDEWTHFTFVFDTDNDTVYFYLNGQLVQIDTAATTDWSNPTGDFCIGGTSGAGSCTAEFDGTIDEVMITAEILRDNDIKRIYETGQRALLAAGDNESNLDDNGGSAGDINNVVAVGVQQTKSGEFAWIATEDGDFDNDGFLNKIDLSSDMVTQHLVSTSSPGPIDDDAWTLAVSPSGLELIGHPWEGARDVAYSYDSYGASSGTSAVYYSKQVTLPENINSAYLWVNSFVDGSDVSSSLTVEASNDGGSTYDTCSTTNSDTNQEIPEQEYVCRFTASDKDLIVRFTFARTDRTSHNYITQYGVGWTASGADLAENYVTDEEDLQIGQVVRIKQGGISTLVGKTQHKYDNDLIGIVSARPGITLGPEDGSTPGYTDESQEGTRPVPIALSGRVPVVTSTENGPIRKGDFLTSSSTPGVAMKATKAGVVLGQALEDLPLAEDGSHNQDRVLTFVNTSYFAGSIMADGQFDPAVEEQELALLDSIFSQYDSLAQAQSATESATFKSTNDFINTLTQSVNLDIVKSIVVQTKALTANILNANKATIKDQLTAPTIRTSLISPVASGSANLVIDLTNVSDASGSAGRLDLLGNLNVSNDATISGSLNASNASIGRLTADSASISAIESETGNFGNIELNSASVSGQLQAYNIEAVNATFGDLIADTLKVATISADTIDGLDAKVDQRLNGRLALLEERIRQFEESQANELTSEWVDESSDSATPLAQQTNQLTDQSTNQPINQSTELSDPTPAGSTGSETPAESDLDLPYQLASQPINQSTDFTTSTSSDLSAEALAEVDALFVNDFLAVTGTASIVTADISGSLSVGGNLLVDHNSLSTIGCRHSELDSESLSNLPTDQSTNCDSTLYLQANGGSLNLLAGLMTLTEDGQVEINGDLNVAGSINTKALTFGEVLGEATHSGQLTNQPINQSTNPAQSDYPTIQLSENTNKTDLEVKLASGSALVIGQNTPSSSSTDLANASEQDGSGISSESATPSASINSDGSARFNNISLTENIGQATIQAGQKTTVIQAKNISEKAYILVSFEGDFSPATRYWTEKDPEANQFKIVLDQPTAKTVTASWLVVN